MERKDELQTLIKDGGKMSVVLTCNVYLAHQWYNYLKEYLPKSLVVHFIDERYGSHEWHQEKWNTFLTNTQVSIGIVEMTFFTS
jgi:excinuclease UvrABC helicase subunit UvrB